MLLPLLLAGCQATLDKPDSPSQSISKPRVELERSTVTQSAPTLTTLADPDSDEFVVELYNYAQIQVGKHFGISLEPVTLKLADNDELEFFVQRETKKLSHAVFHNNRFADFFVNKVIEDQTGTYAGLYVSPENQVVLNRELLTVFRNSLRASLRSNSADKERDLISQSLLALIIHELVHAADNERFQIHNRRELNFRASVAQSAVFEGHAQLATREICGKLNCLEGLRRLDAFMFEAPEPTDPVARSLQAVSRNVLEYAYVEGERFLQSLKNLPNGKQRLEAALKNPPEDPVQILDPENYPDNARVQRNHQIFSQLRSLDHKWNSPEYALIETSPIKGLDLRSDPGRREATKEGFTRLIRSMVGAQLFNQQATRIQPVEITVMQTESQETADLFSKSFQEKATQSTEGNTYSNTLHLIVGDTLSKQNAVNGESWPMRVFLAITKLENTDNPNEPDTHYVNLIANAGNWIIQMGGVADPGDISMISFSELAMHKLLSGGLSTEALLKSDKLRRDG